MCSSDLVATPEGPLEASLPATVAGGYVVRWKRLDGTERERLVAVNVDPDEGRLERIGRERLDRTGVTRWVVREADVPIGWCGLKWSGVRPVDERACARMAEAAE